MKKNQIMYPLFLNLVGICFLALISCANAGNNADVSADDYAIASENVNHIAPFMAASVQFNPTLTSTECPMEMTDRCKCMKKVREENITRLISHVNDAITKHKAKLVIAPEMATTGYIYKNREDIHCVVDTIPGSTTDRFYNEVVKKHARKGHDVYIVAGMPEVDEITNIYYNSSFLVGPQLDKREAENHEHHGYIGTYRKIELWESEAHWAQWGNLGVPVYKTKIGNIALNICMDSAYFESARLAAVGGANILAFSTNSSSQTVWALQARAEQNGLYIVSANRSNTETPPPYAGGAFHMVGLSAIWSPSGKKLVEANFSPSTEYDINKTEIIAARIDPSNYKNAGKARLAKKNEAINNNPNLYQDLMLKIAPWDLTKTKIPHNVTAAVIQYEPEIGNRKANRKQIKELIDKANAKNPNIDLIVLPELSTTGPVDSRASAKANAESSKGATFNFFRKIAIANKQYIVFTMIEKDKVNDNLYNSAILIDIYGNIVGTYRKVQLSDNDKHWATPGSDIPVFTIGLGKIGIMIGNEVAYPEIFGVLMVNRADIIAVPSSADGTIVKEIHIDKNASPYNRYPEGTMALWDSVAISAQAYTLIANYVGNNYIGRSALYTILGPLTPYLTSYPLPPNPFGGLQHSVVASIDKEEALIVDFATIQPQYWFNQEKVISSRRASMYTPLVSLKNSPGK